MEVLIAEDTTVLAVASTMLELVPCWEQAIVLEAHGCSCLAGYSLRNLGGIQPAAAAFDLDADCHTEDHHTRYSCQTVRSVHSVHPQDWPA